MRIPTKTGKHDIGMSRCEKRSRVSSHLPDTTNKLIVGAELPSMKWASTSGALDNLQLVKKQSSDLTCQLTRGINCIIIRNVSMSGKTVHIHNW